MAGVTGHDKHQVCLVSRRQLNSTVALVLAAARSRWEDVAEQQ